MLHVGKCDYLIKLLAYLALPHSEYSAVQKDIFSPSQLTMKSRSDFKQTGCPAAQCHAALGGFRDTAENLEQRAFACPVSADDTDNLSSFDVEANVLQSPKFLHLVPLDDLAAAQNVNCLTRKITRFARQHIAQCHVL